MSDFEKKQCTDRDAREQEQKDDLRARVETLERELEKLKEDRYCEAGNPAPMPRHLHGPFN